MGIGFHFCWDQRGISPGGNNVSIGKEIEGQNLCGIKMLGKTG